MCCSSLQSTNSQASKTTPPNLCEESASHHGNRLAPDLEAGVAEEKSIGILGTLKILLHQALPHRDQ
jgi:hypothetical protein